MISIGTRLGIVLGIVLLMTLKPSLATSILIVALAGAIGWLASPFLITARRGSQPARSS